MLYRLPESPTMELIAESMGTTYQNVHWVLKVFMPEAERKALSAIRYHHSKTAEKNPMYGKLGDQHHNWIGLVDDGYGYLTSLRDGKRQFVHRIVMADALGLSVLPEKWHVHHIDSNPKNNHLDNLALVTMRGHRQIHLLQQDSMSVLLKKSTLREALQYMTSQ